MRVAGLHIDQRIILGTEWGQYSEGTPAREAGTYYMRRGCCTNPNATSNSSGAENYDIALGDCLWHIYRLIGKLSDRVNLLSTLASGRR